MTQDPNNPFLQILNAKLLATKGDMENAKKIIAQIKAVNPMFIDSAFKQDESLRKMFGE